MMKFLIIIKLNESGNKTLLKQGRGVLLANNLIGVIILASLICNTSDLVPYLIIITSKSSKYVTASAFVQRPTLPALGNVLSFT